jgi:hypothetical protein
MLEYLWGRKGAVVSTCMRGRVHLRFEARAARLGRDDRVEPFGHLWGRKGAVVSTCMQGRVHRRFVSSPSATTEPASAPKTALVRSAVACRTELYMRLRATTAVSAAATRARPV